MTFSAKFIKALIRAVRCKSLWVSNQISHDLIGLLGEARTVGLFVVADDAQVFFFATRIFVKAVVQTARSYRHKVPKYLIAVFVRQLGKR